MTPSHTALSGAMKPAAGVTATSPTTAPVATPTVVGRPVLRRSISIQTSSVAAGASSVFTNACAATGPDDSALPPLNPNQPNHNSAAPRMTYGTLWGRNAWRP